MKHLLYTPLLFLLAGCPSVSDQVSEKTGTTIEQRCAARAAAVEVYKAQPEYGMQNDTGARLRRIEQAYRSYTTLICPPPWGVAPSNAPKSLSGPEIQLPE